MRVGLILFTMSHYIINQERNIRPYAEIPLADQVNKSNSCLGARVPGNESSTYGTFAPGSESTWERKFHNSNCTMYVTTQEP